VAGRSPFDIELDPPEILERNRQRDSFGRGDDETSVGHGQHGLGSPRLQPELFARLEGLENLGFEPWSGVHLPHLCIHMFASRLYRRCGAWSLSAVMILYLRRCISAGRRRRHPFATHDTVDVLDSRGGRKVTGVILWR
jgi:hypothetical protein